MSVFKGKKTYGEEPLRQIIRGKGLTLRPYLEEIDEEPFYKMLVKDEDFRQSMHIVERGEWFRKCYLKGRVTFINYMSDFGFVIERDSDKAAVGFISMSNGYGYSHHVLTLSYFVGKQYRHQGYMDKALSMIIDHGFKGKLYQFDDLAQKNRLYVIYAFKAFVDLENEASSHLLEKMGFSCSGIEYCHSSSDYWPAKDRAIYYLENPKHPPIRD